MPTAPAPLQGGLGGSEAQLEALLALRCAYPRAVLAAHALAGLACASLREDRFGILQLTQASGGTAHAHAVHASVSCSSRRRAGAHRTRRAALRTHPWPALPACLPRHWHHAAGPLLRLCSVPVQPSLGDVLLCLLSALGAAQQMMRSCASLAPRQLSLGPWRGSGDAAAGALHTQLACPAARVSPPFLRG